MKNDIVKKANSVSGIGTGKIILFFLISTTICTWIALIVSRSPLDKNFLNAIPLSVGFISILLLERASALHLQKTTSVLTLTVILAALVLETLRAYVPTLKFVFNIILIGFLLLILFRFWKNPLPQIGAYFSSGIKNALVLAILFGLMPQGLSYAILSVFFSGSVAGNPDWSHAGRPFVGMFFLFSSLSIGYLNCLVGEEAGWRGFLVRGMAERYTRGKFIWLSSILFALWHLPYDLIIANLDPVNLIVNQVVRIINGASFAYFFVATGWSLIPVSLFHTMHNFVGYSIVNPTGPFVAKPSDIQGLIFVILYLLITVVVLIIVRLMAIRKGEWSPPGVPNSIREGTLQEQIQKNNA